MSDRRIVAAAIKEGPCVFTGPHHAAIIHYIVLCAKIRPVRGQQGFLTSEGQFVDRKEALRIAVEAGQLGQDYAGVGGLLSEMLWVVPND